MRIAETKTKDYDIRDFGLNPQPPDVLDSSRLKDFVKCPALFYYKHVLGLSNTTRTPSNALAWGNKWHEVMYQWHKDWEPQPALDALEPWPDQLDKSDKYNRTRGRMETLLLAYIDKYGRLDEAMWEILRREQYFEIHCEPDDSDCPFGGCGLHFCGRMDALRRSRSNDKIYVWDYKTTGYKRANYFKDLKRGFQIPGYIWAAHHIVPHQSTIHAQIDLLHCTKTKGDFYRQELRVNADRLVEWRDQVKTRAEQIQGMLERWPESPEEWPKDWGACNRYWECEFTDIHLNAPDAQADRLKILESDYEEDRWDPSDLPGE